LLNVIKHYNLTNNIFSV